MKAVWDVLKEHKQGQAVRDILERQEQGLSISKQEMETVESFPWVYDDLLTLQPAETVLHLQEKQLELRRIHEEKRKALCKCIRECRELEYMVESLLKS